MLVSIVRVNKRKKRAGRDGKAGGEKMMSFVVFRLMRFILK